MAERTALLSIEGVSKAFGPVYAIRNVNLEIFPGECVALAGENGAGKSTLMKVLSGVWPHGTYEGKILFEGKELALTSPLEGRVCGISIIHQELCLFPKLSVAENLFLTEAQPYDGTPSTTLFSKVNWEALYATADNLLRGLGFEIDPRAAVEELSVAQRQLVEIARAVHQNAKLLILDEPTSALSQSEVRSLFAVIQRMRKSAMSFVYISHKMDEIFELSDRIVVLRDGQSVADLTTEKIDSSEVIRHMVGRPLRDAQRTSHATDVQVLRVENLSHESPTGKTMLADVGFTTRKGEVLGIAGLMGAGRSELLRSILGVLPGTRTGNVYLDGQPISWESMSEAISGGVGFVPEDRKKDGLFLDQGIDFNLSISVLRNLISRLGKLDLGRESRKVVDLANRMHVRRNDIKLPVKSLSGGNQQKVLLGKVMASSPRVLFLDEPTRGIDVGAKEEVYDLIRELAASGLSVVVVSSELPEILALADRVLVMREGRVAAELTNDHLTQEVVMSYAAGEANV